MASPQYVYVMNKLSKTYPGGKQVLKDMTLAFLPGAKIGVVGSTARASRRCCASWPARRTSSWARPGRPRAFASAYLPQEPQLDQAKDVTGNVMEGVAEKKAKLDRYNELAMNYSDETADEMSQLQDEIDAGRACGTSTPRSSRPWMRCAARRATPRLPRYPAARSAASRSASCSLPGPTSSCSTSRPTISMPRASPGSSIICATIRHRGHGHP